MPINQELLTFASSRAPWLRDCLRRICTQSDLTPSDIQEVFKNLKATEGLEQAGNLEHLDASHLTNRAAAGHVATILTSVSDVKNANRLASNQTLLFAESGITLIYGYNGSGKTGYGRILKQVCRSRHEKQDPILGDVYAQGGVTPASATIGYKSGGNALTTSWQDGSSAPQELSRISVFDATTAPLYADQQNKIEFLPLGLDALPRLAKVCEELSGLIVAKINVLNSKLAIPLPSVASVAFVQFIGRLAATIPAAQVPTDTEIMTLFVWNVVDDAAILALEDDMRKLSEPATLSAQYARLKRSLENVKTKMNTALAAFTSEQLATDYKKYTDAKAARDAATIAASGRFATDPLGDAPTTDVWRRLFESAEAFNTTIYPDEEFPATGEGRICLLCQQPLSDSATDRFERFREFLRDTTQKDALRAETALADTARVVSAVVIPVASDIDQQLQELTDVKLTVISLRDRLKQQSIALNVLKSEFVRCLKGDAAIEGLPTVDQSLASEVDEVLVSLNAEMNAFDEQTKDTSKLRDLKNKHTELLDRKNCASNQAIFLARRADLCSLESWKKCKTQCDTTAISRKSTGLRETYLTEDFRKRVMAEVKMLGLDYLPLKVEGRTDRGVGYIGVALSKTGRELTSRILSEGEFRGLALACFFAEIGSIDGHDGIIVDDPVSSLDHLHVAQVARRLVQEAQARPQVVVFTHDLAFYYDLLVAASEARIPLHRNWIYTDGQNGFGKVASDDGPWQVKKVRERLPILEAMVKSLPDSRSCPPAEYQQKTEEFYSKLRETWERVVEECLLNDVVGRFQPGVATQSLKGVEVTDADYTKIFFAMKKASEFSGHDRAAGRPPVVRSRDEMRNDLGELWTYEKDLRRRSEALGKTRRVLENPPAAVTSPPQA
jgi:energy-coupling factor transporter ATP-binding protein EcfA2